MTRFSYFFAGKTPDGSISQANSAIPPALGEAIALFENTGFLTDKIVPATETGDIFLYEIQTDGPLRATPATNAITEALALRNPFSPSTGASVIRIPYPDDVLAFALSYVEKKAWGAAKASAACKETVLRPATLVFPEAGLPPYTIVSVTKTRPRRTPGNHYRKHFWRTIPQKVADIATILSERSGENIVDCTRVFLSSETYLHLADESTKSWHLGARQLLDAFLHEKSGKA